MNVQVEVTSREKVHAKIMFIGHVGTGKTTIIDRLLHSNGRNDRRTMDTSEKEIAVVRALLLIHLINCVSSCIDRFIEDVRDEQVFYDGRSYS